METKTLGAHTIRYYDDLDDLPVDRLTPFMKALADSGSEQHSLDAMTKRIGQIASYVTKGDTKKAQELLMEHLQQLGDLQNTMPPIGSLAFACLIAEVDGVKTDDLSEMALTVLADRVGNFQLNPASDAE